MDNKSQNDEMSLFDLFAVIWCWRKMIIVITSAVAIFAVVISIISLKMPSETSFSPNVYTPKALILINDPAAAGGGGGLSARLNASNLASFAGVRLPTGITNSQLAKYLMQSNTLLDAVINEFDMINLFEIKEYPKASSRNKLKKLLTATIDEKSGVMSLGFTHRDPVFARDVVNYATLCLAQRFDELGLDKNKIEKDNLETNIATTFYEILQLEEEGRNLERSLASTYSIGGLPSVTATDVRRIALELTAKQQIYNQLKVQYELLKVNMASEKPPFQIVEMAEIPDMKSGPSRSIFCFIATFVAGFFSILLAFMFNMIANIRNDPESMAKLRKNQ